jgi:uncharacterized membrane protein
VDVFTFLIMCVVGFFVVTRVRHLSAKIEPLEKDNTALRDQLPGVIARVHDLEKTLEKSSLVAPQRSPSEAGSAQRTAIPTPPIAPTAAKVPPRAETPQRVHVVPPAPATPPPAAMPTYAPPPSPPPIYAAQPPARTPSLLGRGPDGEKKMDSRNLADLEARLGANWLNKIGTAAFVIGVALLLNYSMHYLGPAGKIALGYALSAAMLGVGVLGERTERYRIAARAELGGGWALAYFTAYASHNIAAVRLVASVGLGFALLFAMGWSHIRCASARKSLRGSQTFSRPSAWP